MIDNHDYSFLIENLRQYETTASLSRSRFFAEHKSEIESIIDRIWRQDCIDAAPRVNDFQRVVQWNILRGKQLDAIAELFNSHPVLSKADLISFNEVDLGMNRTENRN